MKSLYYEIKNTYIEIFLKSEVIRYCNIDYEVSVTKL